MKKFLFVLASLLIFLIVLIVFNMRYFLFQQYYEFTPNIRQKVDLSSPGLIYSGKVIHNHPVFFKYGFIMEGMDIKTFQLNYNKLYYDLPPHNLKVRIDFFNQRGEIVSAVTNYNKYSVNDTMSAPAFELGTYSTSSGLPLNEPLICNVTLLEIDDGLHKYGPFTFFIKPFYTL